MASRTNAFPHHRSLHIFSPSRHIPLVTIPHFSSCHLLHHLCHVASPILNVSSSPHHLNLFITIPFVSRLRPTVVRHTVPASSPPRLIISESRLIIQLTTPSHHLACRCDFTSVARAELTLHTVPRVSHTSPSFRDRLVRETSCILVVRVFLKK
jgi:hypothetical protein